MRKLTPEQQKEIITLSRGGVTQKQLALDYGVSRATIQNTIRGYTQNLKKKHRLTPKEWNQLAKENHKRISRRKDAVPGRAQESYSEETSKFGYGVRGGY